MEKFMNDLGYLLHKAARLTKGELNHKLSELGLTLPQFVILKDVYCHERHEDMTSSLTPASIAERINADRPTVSGIIHRLTNQGWIRRVEKPNDRRSQIIVLTDKSRQFMNTLESLNAETIKQGTKDFSEEEIETFRNYLLRMIDNFTEKE